VLAEARSVAHPLSRCTALIWCGGVIPLWLGDLDAAEQSIAELKDHAQLHNLSALHAYGIGLEGQLAAQRDDLRIAERLLRFCVEYLRERQSDNYPGFLDTLALVLARSGRCEEGLAAAEEVLRRIERTKQLWLTPEALRIKGEILLLSKANADATAADCFVRSGEFAYGQGALAWELRATTSLARLLRNEGRAADARKALQPVYSRFTEGFDTADLKSAKALLDALG
jgi:predicted ATPase